MQSNIIHYAHTPLNISRAVFQFSELWHQFPSKRLSAMVRLSDPPIGDRKTLATTIPTVEACEPKAESDLPVARPSFSGQYVYINREQSLLRFYRRVLEEAQDETQPLLERIKFLSIVGSNLAEFFMVRVAGIKQQIAAGIAELSPDGLMPTEQLAAIRPMVLRLMNDARDCLGQLLPKLDQAGIHILDYTALDEQQRAGVQERFDEIVFPALTPMANDPGRPFPHISNMSLNLAILLRDPQGIEHFARVKVPSTLPRLIPVKSPLDKPAPEETLPREHYFVWLEQVIAANLGALFPGMTIIEAHPFRVTRDAELFIETEAEDLLGMIEQSVRQRRFGSVTRVTANRELPPRIREILIEQLDITEDDIYTVDPPLGMSDLMQLHKLDRPDLKDPPFVPTIPAMIHEMGDDIFAAIRHRDMLLHHPYDSFTPVLDFLSTAAGDPNVLAIKQMLYRVGRHSPVAETLLQAAQNGKQVAALVELKARFDEENNIEWAKTLEHEGVHVVYGLPGLKTHCKILLVVRQEGERVRRYVHLSSGNYNPVTAQIYTDLALFTCDPAMCADATDVFNYLTGYSTKSDYHKFLVSPINLRAGVKALIQREIDHQRRGEHGHLIFKVNALIDKKMIQLLYQASQAGVQVDLLARGMCSLRPGVEGLSENIRVISIVGRFLEHSRIYYFRNGGKEEIYLGSADLMPRNLDRRVEILFPLEDQSLVRYLRDQVLPVYLSDTVKARHMQPDATYRHAQPEPGALPVHSQTWFIPRSG
jgi:polyphosphate kinase